MDDETRQRILDLEQQRDKAVFEAQGWGFQLKDANEEIERLKPLWHKFYRNPFYWLIRPLDEELDGKILMQCIGVAGKGGCSKLFWVADDGTPGIHTHHIHQRAEETTVWQYIKARYLPWMIRRAGEPGGAR